MNEAFDGQAYMTQGVENLVASSLRNEGFLLEDHAGGCVLYEKKQQIQELLLSTMSGK